MRSLPIRLSSEFGESFASYLNRIAAQHDVPLSVLLSRTGLIGEGRKALQPSIKGYGVVLPSALLKQFSHITRLPEEAISAMLLAHYDGIAVDFSELRSSDSDDYSKPLSKVPFKQWAYFVGSHICPQCLSESGGIWRLSWKLPWSFACVHHHRLLADTCTSCGKRTSLERGAEGPASPSNMLLPTECRNPALHGKVAVPGGKLCGCSLDTLDAESLNGWPRLIEVQRRINRALEGYPQSVAGEDILSLDYFRDLRSICAMLLYLGRFEDLGQVPRVVGAEFESYVEDREETRESRARRVSAGEDPLKITRLRPYVRTPHSASLMAALVPAAVDILDAYSVNDLASTLEPFVCRGRELTQGVDEVFLSFLAFSPRLEEAFIRAWRPMRSRALFASVGSHGRRTVDPDLVGLDPDHVPQLLWEKEYTELFAELLPGRAERYARRVCSMALLKVTGRYSWKSAAEELGLPVKECCSLATSIVYQLNQSGTKEIFDGRLRGLGKQIATNPNRVDYGARRRLLSGFVKIRMETWKAICKSAEMGLGRTRRFWATVWLWCHLTGGDFTLSPWFKKNDSVGARRRYLNRFVAKDLYWLEDRLIEYGATLLKKLVLQQWRSSEANAALNGLSLGECPSDSELGESLFQEPGEGRTLPIRDSPVPEETFASYADRLAASHGVSLNILLVRMGIIAKERASVMPRGYGIYLSTPLLRRVADVTRLSEREISDMLLTRYDGVCVDFAKLDTFPLPNLATQQWAYFAGSHVCPSCLEERGGAWKLSWKLPWSFACVDHGKLLVDTCPSCERRTGRGRTDGRIAPAFRSRVPTPLECRNALPPGKMFGAGRASIPCGCQLTTIEARPLEDWPHLLTAQRRINEALNGRPTRVAGEQVSSMEYFYDLRSLCALLLAWGTPEDFKDAPPFALEEFAEHVERREEVQRTRQELIAGGGDVRKAPKFRVHTGVPQSTALMSLLASKANAMLESESPATLTSSLEPFFERLRQRHKRDVPTRMDSFLPSPRLQNAFEEGWRSHQQLTRKLGINSGAKKRKDLPERGPEPRYVPQLLWEDSFMEFFAELMPEVRSINARRVCSMALVKLGGDYTWTQAAEELNLPAKQCNGMANRIVGLITKSGTGEIFGVRLRELARRVADDPRRIDYDRRRCLLSDLSDIPFAEWERICKVTGTHPGTPGVRSRHAATWLWCYLTGGDYRLSPWLAKAGTEDSRARSLQDRYLKFLQENLEKVRDELVAYGDLLLERIRKGEHLPQQPVENQSYRPPATTHAYPEDLRLQVVSAVDRGEYQKDVAHSFGISSATVRSWLRRRRDFGTLAPKRTAPFGPPECKRALWEQFEAYPDETLKKHCQRWEKKQGSKVSDTAMRRALLQMGWAYDCKNRRWAPPNAMSSET